MRSRTFLPVLGIALAVLASVPARASTVVTSSRFTLTFSSEWMNYDFLPVDTAKILVDTAQQATCNLTATFYPTAVTAQQLADSMGRIPEGTSTFTKIGNGTVTLGANTFSYTEWQGADASDANMRVRIYATYLGNLLFSAAVVYQPIQGNTVVTQVESALATLVLHASAGIRPWAAFRQLHPAFADHDALGRFRSGQARMALFALSSVR